MLPEQNHGRNSRPLPVWLQRRMRRLPALEGRGSKTRERVGAKVSVCGARAGPTSLGSGFSLRSQQSEQLRAEKAGASKGDLSSLLRAAARAGRVFHGTGQESASAEGSGRRRPLTAGLCLWVVSAPRVSEPAVLPQSSFTSYFVTAEECLRLLPQRLKESFQVKPSLL